MATNNFEKPLTISIGNRGKSTVFAPYRENFDFRLNTGDSITFDNVTSEEGIYYIGQATKDLIVNAVATSDESAVVTGKYVSSTNTFTAGTCNSAIITGIGETETEGEAISFKIIGTLPYEPADNLIGMVAGNRFIAKITNKNITAKSDLPSGDILVIGNSDGNEQTYTKSAFEDDGSLYMVTNERPNSVLTLAIEWEDDKISTYTFSFADATFAQDGETAEAVEVINITLPLDITITNNSSLEVGFTPYRENSQKYIGSGDSLVLTVNKAEEAMYYIRLKSDDLSITF